MRTPNFAGTYYEKASDALQRQVTDLFTSERGPGDLPATSKKSGHIDAVIVPHSPYPMSGACAAWAYHALAQVESPELYVLIGPSSHGKSGYSIETVQMPFGEARTDQPFAQSLAEKGTILRNEDIHASEPCLEVQLPLLQFIHGQRESVRVLQILIGDDIDLATAALDIKETIADTGKRVCYVVATNFTHFGSKFHYVPFSKDVQENIYAMDREAIEFIKKLDHEGFSTWCHQKFSTINGQLPIQLLLRLIRSKTVELEHYYTSGDVNNDYKNCISYASIIFRP